MDLNEIDLMVGWEQAGLTQCTTCGSFFKEDDGGCDSCIEVDGDLDVAAA